MHLFALRIFEFNNTGILDITESGLENDIFINMLHKSWMESNAIRDHTKYMEN